MSLTKFTEVINIDCNDEFVFDYTQDYSNRLKWDTFLKRADLIEGALAADKGVKAYCVATNGIGMVTEYVTFNRPKVTAVKMTKGPYMFKSFLGSWTFKALSRESTQVVFLYVYELRFPFSLGFFLMKPILQMNVRNRLKGLKVSIENLPVV